MSELQDALAELSQGVEQLVVPPEEPFGYGVDYHCLTDLTERLDQVSGTEALALALLRRLSTQRGELPGDSDEEADYGTDLLGYLNRGSTQGDLRALEAIAAAECTKDPLVASAIVTVSGGILLGAILDVTIRVVPEDPDLTEFTLVGALTPDGPILKELLGGG